MKYSKIQISTLAPPPVRTWACSADHSRWMASLLGPPSFQMAARITQVPNVNLPLLSMIIGVFCMSSHDWNDMSSLKSSIHVLVWVVLLCVYLFGHFTVHKFSGDVLLVSCRFSFHFITKMLGADDPGLVPLHARTIGFPLISHQSIPQPWHPKLSSQEKQVLKWYSSSRSSQDAEY